MIIFFSSRCLVVLTPFIENTILSSSFSCGSAGKGSADNAGDLGSIPGLGGSPGKGKATQSSILAWRISWTIAHGVTKSQTPLRYFYPFSIELTLLICQRSVDHNCVTVSGLCIPFQLSIYLFFPQYPTALFTAALY